MFSRMVGGIVDCGICCWFSEDVDFLFGWGVELVHRENLGYCCVQR